VLDPAQPTGVRQDVPWQDAGQQHLGLADARAQLVLGAADDNLGASEDSKKVEVWEYQGNRVDIFFLK